MDYYLIPHDGAVIIGPFASPDDATTFYHANLDMTGADIREGTDPTSWLALQSSGGTLDTETLRFNIAVPQETPVVPGTGALPASP